MATLPEAKTTQNALGEDIRALRKARGLTLQELAGRLGRSVGWLSQVERGKSDISLTELGQLAEIFDVPRGFFFMHDDMPEAERGRIVRAEHRRVLGEQTHGLIEELLSPDLGGSFEMFRSVFKPGAQSRTALRQTEEAGYVIAGSLDIWISEQHFTLYPGDSFRFDHEPFRWRNSDEEPAVVIWTISPPVY